MATTGICQRHLIFPRIRELLSEIRERILTDHGTIDGSNEEDEYEIRLDQGNAIGIRPLTRSVHDSSSASAV